MRKLLCVMMLFMVTGCASTDLTGYVDPAYQHHNLGKTIICIKGADMGEVFEAEEKISLMLADYNIKSLKYSEVILPTRENRAAEGPLLRSSGADSLLLVAVAKGSVEDYVPPTYTYGKYGTTVSGGYYTTDLIMATKVTVFDMHTGNQIYTADGKSDGGLSYISLLLNAAKTALKDMEKKGLIHKLPTPREDISDASL
ncbi:hypothetical protein [Desulfovibrio sp.]